MISSITEISNDLTQHVINSFNENNMTVNESVLQTVLFRTKMELGSDHPISQLPYYWCGYGPFCETLRNSFNFYKNHMDTTGGSYSLSLIPDSTNFVNEYPEIDENILRLVSKGDYVYTGLIRDIYKNFAPLNMIYMFKFKIFSPAQKSNFCCSDDYIDAFKLCQADFYLNHYNEEYNLIFSQFTTLMELLNDANLVDRCWCNLQVPIKHLWFTFAEGLRIKAHDSYYDASCAQWNMQFKDSLSRLGALVNDVVMDTLPLIDFSNSLGGNAFRHC